MKIKHKTEHTFPHLVIQHDWLGTRAVDLDAVPDRFDVIVNSTRALFRPMQNPAQLIWVQVNKRGCN